MVKVKKLIDLVRSAFYFTTSAVFPHPLRKTQAKQNSNNIAVQSEVDRRGRRGLGVRRIVHI